MAEGTPSSGIALGIKVPETSGPDLSTVGQFAKIQNWLNTSRLFQQTFAARQRAGEIMAASPDIDSAIGTIQKDPLASAFAPELVNMMRQIELTQTQIAKTRVETATAGNTFLGDFMKNLAIGYNDPSKMKNAVNASARLVPQGAAGDSIRQAMGDVIEGVVGGLPDDLSQWKQADYDKYHLNLQGNFVAGGMTPELQGTLVGTTGIQRVGDRIVPTVQAPPALGGGLREAPGSLSLGLEPQVREVPGPQGQAQTMILGGRYGAGGVPTTSPGLGAPGAPASSLAIPSPSPQAPSGGGQTIAVGPTKTDENYYIGRGKDMADYQKSLDTDVSSGYQIMQNTQEARQALKDFKPGGGADVYRRIAQVAQGFGASDQLVDKIANGNLASTQEFQKIMVNNVMSQIKQQLPSGSRLAQYEFRVFEDRNPNIDTDPRAIDKVFNFWTKLYGRATTEQNELNKYLDTPGSNISRWPAVWQAKAKDLGFIQGFASTENADQGRLRQILGVQ